MFGRNDFGPALRKTQRICVFVIIDADMPALNSPSNAKTPVSKTTGKRHMIRSVAIRSAAANLRTALWLLTSAFILLIMFVSFGDVTMRTFAKPIPGAYEVTEIAVGAMVFAALPIVTLKNEHVSVTLLSALTARIAWLRWSPGWCSGFPGSCDPVPSNNQ
ncbi:hypothetical protein DA792_13625 [Celeribacter baekdonensis]|uniref:TRAP transporter small permease protein n=1 Tax=Celeribacter baekdonensis TaxID=875171 RepID=A0A2R4M4F7_9RHOB|nr:hypothetical protein DA792_13625 [Celeribacter baekdonensis]